MAEGKTLALDAADNLQKILLWWNIKAKVAYGSPAGSIPVKADEVSPDLSAV